MDRERYLHNLEAERMKIEKDKIFDDIEAVRQQGMLIGIDIAKEIALDNVEKTCHIIETETKRYDDYDRYETYHDFNCSNCNFHFDKCEYCDQSNWWNYCPRCGCRIEDKTEYRDVF